MNRITTPITRNESVLTGKQNLEKLAVFQDFPVFMGCVDTSQSEDIFADMEWNIDPETGIIQLDKLIPLDILYLNQHNDGVGKIWKDLYSDFATFIAKHYHGMNVLEIGGAHDIIAQSFLNIRPGTQWTIIEPNPENIENKEVKVIKGWFDDKFSLPYAVDAIVHSHVLEHTFNPRKFIEHIGNFLQVGDKHIFAFPNMLPMLEQKFTNCLNFEHTIFLTEYVVDYLLQIAGFRIIEKKYFGNPHSIFYATEKIQVPKNEYVLENMYVEYKKIFENFVEYHKKMVKELNEMIEKSAQPVYLFGAHIFSQYLINFGLNTEKVVSILDNSPLKQGKRLYGTSLMVESPKVLGDMESACVILKAGIYNEEIEKDILENINDNVFFF